MAARFRGLEFAAASPKNKLTGAEWTVAGAAASRRRKSRKNRGKAVTTRVTRTFAVVRRTLIEADRDQEAILADCKAQTMATKGSSAPSMPPSLATDDEYTSLDEGELETVRRSAEFVDLDTLTESDKAWLTRALAGKVLRSSRTTESKAEAMNYWKAQAGMMEACGTLLTNAADVGTK